MEIILFIMVLLFLGFIFLMKKNQPEAEQDDAFPYFKISALLTPAELSFYHVLKIAVSEQYDIFSKVRVADLISVQKGLERAKRSRAFNKINAKHIDFILCDKTTSEILCAIELDDKSHTHKKRQDRDVFLEKALAAARLPLVRFKVSNAYQSSDIERQVRNVLGSEVIEAVPGEPDENSLDYPDPREAPLTKERSARDVAEI